MSVPVDPGEVMPSPTSVSPRQETPAGCWSSRAGPTFILIELFCGGHLAQSVRSLERKGGEPFLSHPPGTLSSVMDMRCNKLEWTDVAPVSRKTLHLGTCTECGSATWRDEADELDPAVAMERVFGSFELVGQMPALRAPGAIVLAYRPPNRRAGQTLDVLTPGRWIEGQPGLWMSTDGTLLLLSPSDPLFVANLTRGA